MPEFAFLYYPSPAPRTLTPEEAAQRLARVRAWAFGNRDRGVLAQAILFEDAGAVLAPDRTLSPVDVPREIPAISIIRARDLEAALEIARSHPGLDYGSTIHVRPMKPSPFGPPAAAAPPPAPPAAP